jgi:hypothetical protein
MSVRESLVKGLDAYVVTDEFFGRPYIDRDEWREEPVPHRNIHGGFEGTDSRFTFYFPPESTYRGRMYTPLDGANAGNEQAFVGSAGEMVGGLPMIERLGGYMVESNMGHIGDVLCAEAGEDPTIYGFRAVAESARLSKFVAAMIYGAPPHHSYVWGGSGGGRRSPGCLEYCPGVWDGALPFMGGGPVGDHGDFRRISGGSGANFSAMFNVQRTLGSRIDDLIDATSPGGSGDVFAGLDSHQRHELAALYRLGYPRGDEWVISQPVGQIWLWASIAERLVTEEADYFEAFWTKPGYVGHDEPNLVVPDLVDRKATVVRTLSARDFAEDPDLQGPSFAKLGPRAIRQGTIRGPDHPIVIEVEEMDGAGYLLGAGIRPISGAAAGRQLWCTQDLLPYLMADGAGEASNQRFAGILPGDEVHIDNRPFLAYCYYYRHHLADAEEWDFLRVDGRPIYPQHESEPGSPFMGVAYSGQYEGKLMWVHHSHDNSLWPSSGMTYQRQVLRAQGAEAAARKFRQRWIQNAEHVPPQFIPSGVRATNTWLVDFRPILEQNLVDLAAWLEEGIEPEPTNVTYHDGKVTFPELAAERGGTQPVVAVTANGGARAEVRVGEEVVLEVRAEAPAGAGRIIALAWDFDGSGTYPEQQELDGSRAGVTHATRHAYATPGTYFATALVHAHVDGDPTAIFRRLPNLASARVVVA